MTKQEFLQEFINYDNDQKLALAVNAGKMLKKLFEDDSEYLSFMRVSAVLFASADNIIDESEVEVYNAVTGDDMSLEAFLEIAKKLVADDKFIKSYWRMINNLRPEVRLVLCYYILTVIGFDDTFSVEEVELILEILPDLNND